MALAVFILVVSVLVHVATGLDRNAGMVVYCTEKGLAMWHKDTVFGEELRSKLRNTRVPNISGNMSSILWSYFDYDLENITLTDHQKPEVQVSITREHGIHMTVIVTEMSFGGNFVLSHNIGKWRQYYGMGNFSVSIFGTTVKMLRKAIVTSDLEAVRYESFNGSCSVESVEIEFHDQVPRDILAQMDERQLKTLVEEELCKSYEFLTEATFNASYQLTPTIHLDKTILGQLIIRDGYIEVHHKGEVRYTADDVDNESVEPLGPALTEQMSPPDRMKVFRMSNLPFNSFGSIVHNRKLLWYNYTTSDLPEGYESLLNTSCDVHCFGTLFPVLSTEHPDSTVELNVSTAEPLRVQISEDGLRVNLTLKTTAYARGQNGDSTHLFTISQRLSAPVDVVIKDSRIYFKIQHPDLNDIQIVDTTIGRLSEDRLLIALDMLFQKVMVSALAYFGQTGFHLAVPKPFSAANSKVKFYKDNVMIMFDYGEPMN